jgi:hypothetical protein
MILSIIAILVYSFLIITVYQDKKLLKKKINKLNQVMTYSQITNNQLNNELEYWQKRRFILPGKRKNTRLKKIRGKRRKGRK